MSNDIRTVNNINICSPSVATTSCNLLRKDRFMPASTHGFYSKLAIIMDEYALKSW